MRGLQGPWLLFDNSADPWQTNNLVGQPAYREIEGRLSALLDRKLKETRDAFLPGDRYLQQWGYTVDATGTVPYTP